MNHFDEEQKTFDIWCKERPALYFFIHRTSPRARPPSSPVESKRLEHLSFEAMQKSTAQRADLRECRDNTKSSHKICSHISWGLPACVVEPPVGADRTRTVVNAAEDNQRKKLKEKCPSLTTVGALTPRGLGEPVDD